MKSKAMRSVLASLSVLAVLVGCVSLSGAAPEVEAETADKLVIYGQEMAGGRTEYAGNTKTPLTDTATTETHDNRTYIKFYGEGGMYGHGATWDFGLNNLLVTDELSGVRYPSDVKLDIGSCEEKTNEHGTYYETKNHWKMPTNALELRFGVPGTTDASQLSGMVYGDGFGVNLQFINPNGGTVQRPELTSANDIGGERNSWATTLRGETDVNRLGEGLNFTIYKSSVYNDTTAGIVGLRIATYDKGSDKTYPDLYRETNDTVTIPYKIGEPIYISLVEAEGYNGGLLKRFVVDTKSFKDYTGGTACDNLTATKGQMIRVADKSGNRANQWEYDDGNKNFMDTDGNKAVGHVWRSTAEWSQDRLALTFANNHVPVYARLAKDLVSDLCEPGAKEARDSYLSYYPADILNVTAGENGQHLDDPVGGDVVTIDTFARRKYGDPAEWHNEHRYELEAGSLVLQKWNYSEQVWKDYLIPKRINFRNYGDNDGNMSEKNDDAANTYRYEFVMPMNGKYQLVAKKFDWTTDVTTDPNMGLVGWNYNANKNALRSVHRLYMRPSDWNYITTDDSQSVFNGQSWIDDTYRTTEENIDGTYNAWFGFKGHTVKRIGVLVSTEKKLAGMDLTLEALAAGNAMEYDFTNTHRRYDFTFLYHDLGTAIVNLTSPEMKAANWKQCPYMVLEDGNGNEAVYYGTVNETSYKAVKDSTMNAAIEEMDFTVEVEVGRDPVVLQITDTQIINADDDTQSNTGLGATQAAYWAWSNREVRLKNYLDQLVNTVKPDLILLTGDMVYGDHDDSGGALQWLIEVMESYNIPWAPVFGNHEAESDKGIDWQCAQLEAAKNCLFKQRTLSGNGNYSVGLVQEGNLLRTFFMLDTHGCSAPSAESLKNDHFIEGNYSVGLQTDQVEWFTGVANNVLYYSPGTQVTFAYHIANIGHLSTYNGVSAHTLQSTDLKSGGVVTAKHEYYHNANFALVASKNTQYWGADYNASLDVEERIAWHAMMRIPTMDQMMVGHEHNIAGAVLNDHPSYSPLNMGTGTDNFRHVVYQYGLKIGTYDETLHWNGSTVVAARLGDLSGLTPVVGGTVSVYSAETGEIASIYNEYVTLNPENPTAGPGNNKVK